MYLCECTNGMQNVLRGTPRALTCLKTHSKFTISDSAMSISWYIGLVYTYGRMCILFKRRGIWQKTELSVILCCIYLSSLVRPAWLWNRGLQLTAGPAPQKKIRLCALPCQLPKQHSLRKTETHICHKNIHF